MNSRSLVMYDRVLFWLILGLTVIGFIMTTSASVAVGQRLENDPFLFAKRNSLYIIIDMFSATITLRLSMKFWQRYSAIMLIISIFMLLIALVIGNSVNGASRWISIGLLRIQPAEFTKLSFFCYLANYLVRKVDEIRNSLRGFLKPMFVILILAILLLAQPDLGTVIVLFVVTLLMLFLAGVKICRCIIVVCMAIVSVVLLIFAEPYRIRRITSFWNPWEDPFDSGYQLTQSLMAFGRGALYGQGLGNSIQKLEYLPEAHTDFIVSVIGEELGYVGAILVLLMIFFISFRAILIGKKLLQINHCFSGFLAYSISIWISFQTLVNVGAATGILPTKGLTLPLISYGGSSLLVMSTASIMLLRMDYEMRLKKIGRLYEKDYHGATYKKINSDGRRNRRTCVPWTCNSTLFNGSRMASSMDRNS